MSMGMEYTDKDVEAIRKGYAEGSFVVNNTDAGTTKTVNLNFTPKVVIFFVQGNQTSATGLNENATSASHLSYGATDGTNSWAVGSSTHYGSPQTGQANAARIVTNDTCLQCITQGEVEDWELAPSGVWSFDFSVDVTGAPTDDRRVHYIAFGGTVVEGEVGTYNVPNSAGGATVDITLPFTPDWIMNGGAFGGNASVNTPTNHGYGMLGFSNGTNHFHISNSVIDAAVTTNNGAGLAYDRFDDLISQGASPTFDGPTCTSVSLGTTTTLTYSARKAASAVRGYVAISGITMEVHQDLVPTTDGTSDLTTTHNAKSCLLFSHGRNGTTGPNANLFIGVGSNSYNGCAGRAFKGQASANVVYKNTSDVDALALGVNSAGSALGLGDATLSISGTTITTDWNNVNGVANLFAVISFGD